MLKFMKMVIKLEFEREFLKFHFENDNLRNFKKN